MSVHWYQMNPIVFLYNTAFSDQTCYLAGLILKEFISLKKLLKYPCRSSVRYQLLSKQRLSWTGKN